MGVDPGLTRCGLSLIEGGAGRSVVALDVDVVRTPADMDLAQRLLLISEAAEYWLDTHKPSVVAIERVFAQHNVRTAMGTAQAGGVIALAAARRGVNVCFHTPSEVKAAVTGNGSADKAQVTAMVMRILGLQTAPTPADAADALALGICHCWRAPGWHRQKRWPRSRNASTRPAWRSSERRGQPRRARSRRRSSRGSRERQAPVDCVDTR